MITTLKVADQDKLSEKVKDFYLPEKEFKEKMVVLENWDQETAADLMVNKVNKDLWPVQEENFKNHLLEDKKNSFNLQKDSAQLKIQKDQNPFQKVIFLTIKWRLNLKPLAIKRLINISQILIKS